MPMVRAMRMLNAIEAGTLSGAQLQALLEDPGRLGEWNVLLGMRGQLRRITTNNNTMSAVAISSTAMEAIMANNTAMDAVVASGVALNAVAESSVARAMFIADARALAAINASDQAARIWMLGGTGQNFANFASVAAVAASPAAMGAVAASPSAMARVVTISTTKLALYESDVALNACFTSSTAMEALRDAATIYRKTASTSSVLLNKGVLPTSLDDAGKYLLLGVSGVYASAGRMVYFNSRRVNSSLPNNITISADHIGASTTAGQLACCPITGPLSFYGSTGASYMAYFSLLRCDV